MNYNLGVQSSDNIIDDVATKAVGAGEGFDNGLLDHYDALGTFSSYVVSVVSLYCINVSHDVTYICGIMFITHSRNIISLHEFNTF